MASINDLDVISGENIREINNELVKNMDKDSFDTMDTLTNEVFPAVFSALKNCLNPLKKNPRYKDIDFLWTGSSSEGVNIPELERTSTGSITWEFEMDMLCVMKDIQIGRTKDDPAMLIMQEGTTHGYFLVNLRNKEYRTMWYDCCTQPTSPTRQSELYLNPLKLVQDLYNNIEHIFKQLPVLNDKFKLEFNPPAVTLTLAQDISLSQAQPSIHISCDIVVALEIPYSTIPESYPLVLNKYGKPSWLSETRYSEVKEGCLHLVGKQSPFGQPEIEWRLSFNRIELALFQELREKCPVAVICYRTLKLIRLWHLKQPKILPSYFMKMVFFRVCDRMPISMWKEESLAYCLFGLLDELIHCLASRSLPSYFVPDYNMLEDRHPDFIQTLLNVLINVRRDPKKYILDVKR